MAYDTMMGCVATLQLKTNGREKNELASHGRGKQADEARLWIMR
jgi:hypothetical protein